MSANVLEETQEVEARLCPYCCGSSFQVVRAQERMFGRGEGFSYRLCDECQSLRIANAPSNLAEYYPQNYYSFSEDCNYDIRSRSFFGRLVHEARVNARLSGHPWYGRILDSFRPAWCSAWVYRLVKGVPGISVASRVLDVGCGRGRLLSEFGKSGFRNLTGADPYLQEDIVRGQWLHIHASDTRSLGSRSFDVVILQHSLEHMDDPRSAMDEVARLLAQNGTCIVAVPLSGSDPWNEYRECWVELDAPRHLTVPSVSGIRHLLSRCGLEIYRTEWDSTEFAYWASELYRRGVSLMDPDANTFRDAARWFSSEEMDGFRARARVANRDGMGGRAVFWARRGESR